MSLLPPVGHRFASRSTRSDDVCSICGLVSSTTSLESFYVIAVCKAIELFQTIPMGPWNSLEKNLRAPSEIKQRYPLSIYSLFIYMLSIHPLFIYPLAVWHSPIFPRRCRPSLSATRGKGGVVMGEGE